MQANLHVFVESATWCASSSKLIKLIRSNFLAVLQRMCHVITFWSV